MNIQRTAILLFFCGAFLLLSGILLIVIESFTPNLTNLSLLISGVLMGAVGFFMTKRLSISFLIGLGLTTLLIFYFGWLTISNMNILVDIVLNGKLQLKPYLAVHQQATATVLSFSAWILTTVITMSQLINASGNEEELKTNN